MEHTESTLFFLQACIMLITALIFGQMARRLGQPSVIGELIGGILLGPTVMEAAFPKAFHMIFPSEMAIVPELDSFIEFGMLLFMFVAGRELNGNFAEDLKRQSFFSGMLGIVVPMCMGVAAGFCFPLRPGCADMDQQWVYALFLGTVLSISSLPVILKTLADLGLLKTEIGTVIMSASAANDFVGWIIFSCLVGFIENGGDTAEGVVMSLLSTGAFILLLFATGFILKRAAGAFIEELFRNDKIAVPLIVAIILAVAAAAEYAGVHALFAVFLLGIVTGKYFGDSENNANELMSRFTMDFFAPIYFVSVGVKVNFLDLLDLPLAAGILIIACVGKIAGAGLGAALGGMSRRQAMCVGFGLNSRGAIGIMISSTALELGMIEESIFVALVVMAIVTSLISGPVIKIILKKEAKVQADMVSEQADYYGTDW